MVTNSNDHVPPHCWIPPLFLLAASRLKKQEVAIVHISRSLHMCLQKRRGFRDNKGSRSELRSPKWLIVLGVECLDDPLQSLCSPVYCPAAPPTTFCSQLLHCQPPTLPRGSLCVIQAQPLFPVGSLRRFCQTRNYSYVDVTVVVLYDFYPSHNYFHFWLKNDSNDCRVLLDFYKFKQAKERKQNLDKPQFVCKLITLIWFKAPP